MNFLGFYRPTSLRQAVDPGRFLVENTIGFAEMYGIPAHDVDVDWVRMGNQVELMIGTPRLPLKKSNVPISEDKPLVVRFNEDIITRNIPLQKYPSCGVTYLWQCVGKALRSWVIDHEQLPDQELLPATLFEKHRFGDQLENLAEKFVKKDWSVRRLKEEIDAKFVSLYLDEYVATQLSRQVSVDEEAVSSTIFKVRRSNHRDYIWNRDEYVR